MNDDYCRDCTGMELCHGDRVETGEGRTGEVVDINKRSGEWWAAVEVENPEERAFWYKAHELLVVGHG